MQQDAMLLGFPNGARIFHEWLLYCRDYGIKKKKFNCWTYGMSTNSKEEYDMIKTLQVNADTNIQTHIIFNLINFTIKLHTTQLHKSLYDMNENRLINSVLPKS